VVDSGDERKRPFANWENAPGIYGSLAAIQQKLEIEKEERRKERFLWCCALIFVFDAYAFSAMSTWSGPIIMGLCQMVFMLAAAVHWGVRPVYHVFLKIVDKWSGHIGIKN